LRSLLVLVLFLVPGLLPAARAAPPEGTEDPAIAAWFQSLKNNANQRCCGVSDCRPEPWRATADGYEVWIQDRSRVPYGGLPGPYRWVKVPKDKVLDRTDNPFGLAVTCHNGTDIFCFVRQSEG
jgi:hypothetical protein